MIFFRNDTAYHHFQSHRQPKPRASAVYLPQLFREGRDRQLPQPLHRGSLELQDQQLKRCLHHRLSKSCSSDIRCSAGGRSDRLPPLACDHRWRICADRAVAPSVEIHAPDGDSAFTLGKPVCCSKGQGHIRHCHIQKLSDGESPPDRNRRVCPNI